MAHKKTKLELGEHETKLKASEAELQNKTKDSLIYLFISNII